MNTFFPATSRYCSNGYLINCTDALEFIVGLTGVCKLRNPQKRSIWTTAPTLVLRHRRFNRRKTLASASGFIAPTPSLCSSSVHPVYSPDLAFSESIAPMITISLSSVQPVIVNCLYLGPFDLISSGVLYLFIPWIYTPDNDHLNTYISPSVVCVINRQNIILKYGMRGHFRYILEPVLTSCPR